MSNILLKSKEDIQREKRMLYQSRYREKLRILGVKRLSDLKNKTDLDKTEDNPIMSINNYVGNSSDSDSEPCRFVCYDEPEISISYNPEEGKTIYKMSHCGNEYYYTEEGNTTGDIFEMYKRAVLGVAAN